MSVSFLIKIPSLHNECCRSGGGKKRKGRIKNEEGREGGQEEERICVKKLLISYRRECLLPFEGELSYTKEGKP